MNPVRSPKGFEILQWLSWADRDYVAARQLLIAGLLVQGTALATTAMEKYLKAIFVHATLKVPRSHKPSDLYFQIKNLGTLSLNEGFLRVITKGYELRYPDDLQPGFNISLNQALLLIALDQAILEVLQRFKFEKDGKQVPLLVERAISENDRRVLDGNAALGTVAKSQLLENPSYCFEFRVLINGAVMEAHYVTAKVEETDDFEKEGLSQKSDKEFILTSHPMPFASTTRE